MNTALLGFLAETSVHPGSGRSMGVVDLPVAREAATDYPLIVGSSLKGALRSHAEQKGMEDVEGLFGEQDRAGQLVVSDARILLLPVRSLTGAYRWVTCPHVLERFRRDLGRAGLAAAFEVPSVEPQHVLAASSDGAALFLEEREFKVGGPVPDPVVEAIGRLIRHEETRNRLPKQIAILHDDDFAYFARYGLSIQARNVLDDEKKTSRNLWYEETLPPDTVLYALVAARTGTVRATLEALVGDADPYLQVGGNETVGHGWMAVTVHSAGEEASA